MKKKVLLILTISIVLVLLAGFVYLIYNESNKGKTIAYIGFSNKKIFWKNLGSSVKEYVEAEDYSFKDYTSDDQEIEDYLNNLKALSENEEIDGVILGIHSSEEHAIKILDKIHEKRIPLVSVDAEVFHDVSSSYVATDNYESAKLIGEYIVKKINGKGPVLIIAGGKDHPNSIARVNGVKEPLDDAGVKSNIFYSEWQESEALDIADRELTKNNNYSAVFAAWDYGAMTASRVIGAKEDIVYAGFDGISEMLEMINENENWATILQPSSEIAKKSVELIDRKIHKKRTPEEVLVPGILITKENVGQYLSVE